MVAEGSYAPPPGEYTRPDGSYILDYPRSESHDSHFVRGVFAHPEALAGVPSGTVALMELVPEPGNPYDPWAVAIHLRGQRIGYISRESSDSLHEYVVGHNRRGRAVFVHGEVEDVDTTRAIVHIPWWRHQESFREDSGVNEECRTLLEDVPQESLLRIMINSQYLDDSDVALLRGLKDAAPSLRWEPLAQGEIPDPLRFVLIDLDKARKATLVAKRAKARDEERDAAVAKQIAAEQARSARDKQICSMAAEGLTVTEIARRFGCSEGVVRKALSTAMVTVVNANDTASLDRLRRAKAALQMQNAGMPRKDIAREIGCSIDTLKIMLRDIKFLQNPQSNPERQQRAAQVQGLGRTMTLQQAASTLGWTAKEVKSARSDAKMLAAHPFASI